jgi:hypothetical protein
MKLYFFSEMPHHEFPDEEAEKYPSMRRDFTNAPFDREGRVPAPLRHGTRGRTRPPSPR